MSTIEALYFFFRDYETTLNCEKSYEKYTKNGGKWDNLLYFYAFNFKLIQECYKNGKLKDQPFRRIPGYVMYEDGNEGAKKVQDLKSGEWIEPPEEREETVNKRK